MLVPDKDKVVEPTKYWNKKTKFEKKRNLASINAERQIFEVSSSHAYVVRKNLLEEISNMHHQKQKHRGDDIMSSVGTHNL